MQLRSARHAPAFSLVELLVALGIITLLLGLVLSSVVVVRQRAQATACKSNLRQVGLMLATYASTNRGYVPRSSALHIHFTPPIAPLQHPHWPNWLVELTRIDRGTRAISWDDIRRTAWLHCPSLVVEGSPSGYVINAVAMDSQPQWAGSPPTLLSSVRAPSRLPWVFEVAHPFPERAYLSLGIELEFLRSIDTPEDFEDKIAWRRHGRSSNVLLADGSVDVRREGEITFNDLDDGIRQRAWR
jgi:prepilin-type processing-associated H-X9-DG protein